MSSTCAPQFLIKAPSERRYYSMDFSNLLNTSESITSIVSITSEKRGGGVTDLLIDDSGISSDGKSIEMYIAGGVDFSVYRIEVRVGTPSQLLEGDGLLKITDK